ncbi:MAG: SDR family NAD(P)-dependent oxidoreductase, partial [Gammaproteobacteria bacterium]|nr:SDR family NAD(P)-dependent oxidoreductase [Gammaproteobacteria bacterium]
MSAPRLDDRVAIITGGAGGIGRALVAALREAGASVAALDIDAPGLDELRESAPGAP